MGEDKRGQQVKARPLLGELKEGFLEEAADDVRWNYARVGGVFPPGHVSEMLKHNEMEVQRC